MALTSETKTWTGSNSRTLIYEFTGDGATTSIDTGLSKIYFSSIHVVSTGAVHPQSTDSAGVITCDALTNGAVFRVLAIGV